MTSYQPPELDTFATDSVASSPRSDNLPHDSRVRFMCSFGGNILPRPHDNQLRYVGGDTRMVAVHRSTTFSSLHSKLSKLSAMGNIMLKYQLPHEDLDALISVTTDEDVENMIDEYDRLAQNYQNPKTARLRLFLFSTGENLSRGSSTISSLLDGSANRENWFIDALNSRLLERGRSEVSSMLSDAPDSLLGLDNSDEIQPTRADQSKVPKSKLALHDNVSITDLGSPAPAIASPYGSTSSALTPCVPPNLPPVKTKPDSPMKENEAQAITESDAELQSLLQVSGNTVMQYKIPDPAYSGYPVQPVYYFPGLGQQGRVPVQQVPAQTPYIQYPAISGQVPVGYHHLVSGVGQVYGGEVGAAVPMNPYDTSVRVIQQGGSNQQMYYGAGNSSVQVAAYPIMAVPGAPQDLQRAGPEQDMGRIPQ